MSGHSKFAKIKHKKAAEDKKRSITFSKAVRELATAVAMGGPDPKFNARLRMAILAAKRVNLPKIRMEDAIKKASSQTDPANYKEVMYEAYGKCGVALIVEGLTDNTNRTLRDVKATLGKYGGNLADPGSIVYMFKHLGYITYPGDIKSEDEMLELAADAGADDCKRVDDEYEIICSVQNLLPVKEFMEKNIGEPTSAERIWQPQTTKTLNQTETTNIVKMIDTLEDFEDVQNVWSNLEIPRDYALPG